MMKILLATCAFAAVAEDVNVEDLLDQLAAGEFEIVAGNGHFLFF